MKVVIYLHFVSDMIKIHYQARTELVPLLIKLGVLPVHVSLKLQLQGKVIYLLNYKKQ